MNKQRVLFVCTGNSIRSQMAEGLLRHLAVNRFEVFSAGIKPSLVNPYAVKVMAEIGIDISHHRSKSVEEFKGQGFDYVTTVCDNAKESCPIFPGKTQRLHWSINDPTGRADSEDEMLVAFREARDDIKNKIIEQLINREDE
ncbi:MAG TPA: arsenate reductase ArsC [Planctomycetota bacterium]|nr:arsenate reductase ArsC [Planctomycetota bacterium]